MRPVILIPNPDIPHFDYIQDDDGGPILWGGNLFDVGLMDIRQIQLVNNITWLADSLNLFHDAARIARPAGPGWGPPRLWRSPGHPVRLDGNV